MDLQKSLVKEALSNRSILPTMQVEYRALINWVDGSPHLVSVPQRLSNNPEEALKELMRKCLDLPYDGQDSSLLGLSQGEAMMVNITREAANGGDEARRLIFDRLLGRPKQSIESVNLSGSLNDFLDRVAEETYVDTVTIKTGPATAQDQYEGEDL